MLDPNLRTGTSKTDRIQSDASHTRQARKGWSQPRLRSVVPASQTRSGFKSGGAAENLSYRVS